MRSLWEVNSLTSDCFSETEHAQFAVCTATTEKVELGIDVAQIDRPLPIKTISKSEYLERLKANESLGTANEWRQIEIADDVDERLNTFLRLWSVKESILKATGLGASGIKPSSIDVRYV